MNQYFGAITMLVGMCEARNITMYGRPPIPLDSLPPNLSSGNSAIPETSLPEKLRPPRRATLELLEHKADEKREPAIWQRAGRDVERDGAPLGSPEDPRAPWAGGD